uniref:PDZ domain-containing protein n=1 Tax=Anolis carolinensis TaxID=28377 RepID=A0A803SWY6_ANOCA
MQWDCEKIQNFHQMIKNIVGGSDHSSHPFGIHEPGVFISKVIPQGLASRSGLRVGDRILEVNGVDLRHATHQEAVSALLSSAQELQMVVRRDPPPPGMEICIEKRPGEKLGISIRGGAKGHVGNPFDPTDEGIFISKVSSAGAAARDGRLRVGLRILEVNHQSLLGMTHTEAVQVLRSVGDALLVLAPAPDPPHTVAPHRMPPPPLQLAPLVMACFSAGASSGKGGRGAKKGDWTITASSLWAHIYPFGNTVESRLSNVNGPPERWISEYVG